MENLLTLESQLFADNRINSLRYGVREAVHEFCVEDGWEFVFLTMEIGDNPSFAIGRIG